MDALFQKQLQTTDVTIINYAAYMVNVIVNDGELAYYPPGIWGMWDIDRYISLLLGEIPRLTDDANGYGPKGKNYLAHVDIPRDVSNAFHDLEQEYSGLVRPADSQFASK